MFTKSHFFISALITSCIAISMESPKKNWLDLKLLHAIEADGFFSSKKEIDPTLIAGQEILEKFIKSQSAKWIAQEPELVLVKDLFPKPTPKEICDVFENANNKEDHLGIAEKLRNQEQPNLFLTFAKFNEIHKEQLDHLITGYRLLREEYDLNEIIVFLNESIEETKKHKEELFASGRTINLFSQWYKSFRDELPTLSQKVRFISRSLQPQYAKDHGSCPANMGVIIKRRVTQSAFIASGIDSRDFSGEIERAAQRMLPRKIHPRI